jgi:hypothetical protein
LRGVSQWCGPQPARQSARHVRFRHTVVGKPTPVVDLLESCSEEGGALPPPRNPLEMATRLGGRKPWLQMAGWDAVTFQLALNLDANSY